MFEISRRVRSFSITRVSLICLLGAASLEVACVAGQQTQSVDDDIDPSGGSAGSSSPAGGSAGAPSGGAIGSGGTSAAGTSAMAGGGGQTAGSGGSNASGGSAGSGGTTLGGAAGIGGTDTAGTGAFANSGGMSGSGNSGAGGSGQGGMSGSGQAGASGAAGKGGTGGTAGAAGKGGTGGTAGKGGTSGMGGSAGTSGSAGAAGSGGCTAPAAGSVLEGWAAVSGNNVTTTTGGGSANPTTVTTLSQLQSAVSGSNAAVVWVQGTITGSIKIGSNKTIAGLCGGQVHGHLDVNNASNVIIRNLKIVGYGVGDCSLDPSFDASVGCSSGNDAISVQGSHHVWIDHDDISDGTDGNLDINNGSNYVTVSWTKFHYTPRTDNVGSDSTGAAGHRYSNLVGSADNIPSDAGKLNVTWHHDWWADNVVEREPRVRYGKNHLYNDLWTSSAANYCVRSGFDAAILIEKSVFNGVKNPQQFNSTADQGNSNISANPADNVYTNTSGTKSTGGGGPAFTSAPYTYAPDATSGLQAAIQSGAGPH
ncbi:MAG TPA: hypothetical protein VGI10_29330 [Polyangiaceae bacterium]|jgi:pectate lyase